MGVRDTAQRLDAATPAGRDRVVDGLRALAMTGVVLGHWLVTGLALTPTGALRSSSPLGTLPGLAPVTWLLETLGLFFFVAGYAAARSLRPDSPVPAWWRGRLARLGPPVVVFLAVWVPLWLALQLVGAQDRTLWTVGKLVVSPLWFLAVLSGLLLLTPVAVAAVRRFGGWAALAPFLVVVLVDALRYGLWPAAPDALGWLNVPAGWLVPYLLGIAVALDRLGAPGAQRRRLGLVLLVGGLGLAVALVLRAGYPTSLVGVPGQGRSNLDPPSLVVVGVAVAQVGAALCLWEPLRRLLRRPLLWAGVVLVNLAIFTIFLWHQTALLLVAGAGLALAGPDAGTPPGSVAGLVQPAAGTPWVVARLPWLAAFALTLALLCLVFRRVERLRFRRPGWPAARPLDRV